MRCIVGTSMGLAWAMVFLAARSLGAGAITVELNAVGAHPDPHNVVASAGQTVQLALSVVEPVENLSSFLTDISNTTGGAFLGVLSGDWFSGYGAYDSMVGDGTSGPPDYYYRIWGYCFANPVSIDGQGDLAIVSFRYDGPDVVTIDAGASYTEFNDEYETFSPVYGDLVVTISLHACACYDGNHDRRIDFVDIGPFSGSYGSSSGDPTYNPTMDANKDGRVDWMDIGPFSGCYGSSW